MIHTVNQMAASSRLVFPGLAEGQRLTGCHEPEAIADVYLQKVSSLWSLNWERKEPISKVHPAKV